MPDTIQMNGMTWSALQAGAVDAAKEKHVPEVAKQQEEVSVTVGSVIHPMEEKHYIEWIALETSQSFQMKYLQPGMEPKVTFSLIEGETVVKAYANCNLHNLWASN